MTISVNQAAKILHKSPEWVRFGIKKGILPFGSCVPMKSGRMSYTIYAGAFANTLGISMERLGELTSDCH